MKTKNLVLMALLVGIGAALYVVIPGISGGVKPDIMLVMMFIGILLFPTFKEMFLLAISTGFISGLFSTTPGGFFPNVIDKAITGLFLLVVILLVKKLTQSIVVNIVLMGISTIISGSIFLSLALFIFKLDIPFGFEFLFITVVLPTVILNCIAFVIIYPIIITLAKRSKFIPVTNA